ncbi:MAG: hypothetical protein KJ944_06845 [Alphaproteobacteria bacterium]|nr:hypothetical protein [Alphaproteobacteria bacterium]MBU1559999.1 hypothetical protein [Alphaproteobacteria bacterium]MBU2302301.1 hypothetical protein [Alphaproteobacteria bacterium]MBU2369425.1 hypothetical protein [Alphaproteobacteria bacterium]
MHIKSIVSAGALAIALGFTGAAAAQTMIGGQTISETDMERVKVHCEDLQNQENAADQGSDNTDAAATTTDTTEEGTEEGTAGLVELDEVTLEQCLEAGLITE